jgi:hypothetical protein
MSPGKVLVHNPPVFALFGKNVCAAPVDSMAAAELHGPVKGRDGAPTVHGHMRLCDVVGEFSTSLQIIVKGLTESTETANPFMLRGRETDEAAVKHLQRTEQIAVVDGADLCAFELKDLLTSGLWHGTPP